MRRKFTKEFKFEAVKLVTERDVSVAQAARDLDLAEKDLCITGIPARYLRWYSLPVAI
jgi:hypothetical protein